MEKFKPIDLTTRFLDERWYKKSLVITLSPKSKPKTIRGYRSRGHPAVFQYNIKMK